MQKMFQRPSKHFQHKIERNFENCFLFHFFQCILNLRPVYSKKPNTVLNLYACKAGD